MKLLKILLYETKILQYFIFCFPRIRVCALWFINNNLKRSSSIVDSKTNNIPLQYFRFCFVVTYPIIEAINNYFCYRRQEYYCYNEQFFFAEVCVCIFLDYQHSINVINHRLNVQSNNDLYFLLLVIIPSLDHSQTIQPYQQSQQKIN